VDDYYVTLGFLLEDIRTFRFEDWLLGGGSLPCAGSLSLSLSHTHTHTHTNARLLLPSQNSGSTKSSSAKS
jgi:hypothetical protein